VVLIETLISATVAALLFFLLVPFLNDFFEGDGQALTAISPNDIGLTVPGGDSSSATMILFGGSLATVWAFRKSL
jgi:hypothetical protein